MKKAKKKFLLQVCTALSFVILVLTMSTYFIFPPIIEMLNDFGGKLPNVLSKFIIPTYQYWIFIPFVTLAICISVYARNESKEEFKSYLYGSFLIGLLIIVLLFFIMGIIAMYIPIHKEEII